MAKTPKPKLKTPTDLGNNVATVADALNGILADSFALYFKTKNFHWHISGPHFRDYHLLFDEQAAQIFATTDLIAERVRKTGNTTLRSVGDISRHHCGSPRAWPTKPRTMRLQASSIHGPTRPNSAPGSCSRLLRLFELAG
jgi:hypothetical protein